MSFSARQLRAINYFAKKNNFRLSLSTLPWVNFVGPTGLPLKYKIKEILEDYDGNRKEEARNRQRSRSVL